MKRFLEIFPFLIALSVLVWAVTFDPYTVNAKGEHCRWYAPGGRLSESVEYCSKPTESQSLLSGFLSLF